MLSVAPDEDVPPLPVDTACGQLGARSVFGDVAMVTMKPSPALKADAMIGGKPTRTAGAQGAEERKRRGSTHARSIAPHADALLDSVSVRSNPPA